MTEPLPDSPELRQSIIDACRRLRQGGYIVGTWGNVSVRLADGLVITPSALDYDLLTPDDLVVVSWQGQALRGDRVPSSEVELHRQLLLARPDLGAVVHTHPPSASALACAHRDLPVMVEDMAQIIGADVRCTSYTPGGRHQALAAAAVAGMGEGTAVLLANHGVVVAGRTLAEAVIATQVLEKAAFIYLSAVPVGGIVPIPAEMVAEERHRYLYKYGKPGQ